MANRVRIAVYTPALVFIAHVPRRRNVTWQNEHNTPGIGGFEIHKDDQLLADHPTLLNDFNVVKVFVNNVPVKAWLIESVTRLQVNAGETAAEWLSVSGRGVLAILGNAVTYPEYALRRDSADDRSFDYGSKDGGWRVTADWHTPVGIRMDSASSIRKGYPVGWPDKASQWLWSSNPNAGSASGRNYFRGSFTLAADTRVRIYAAGDDRLQLQLDGEVIFQTGAGKWHHPATRVMILAAGTHLLAGYVDNIHGTAYGTAAGFLCCVAKVDTANRVLSIIKRSAPSTFTCRGYGSPPGWFGASILKTLVAEAKARSVDGFSPITYGFSDTIDSNGNAWTGRHDRSFRIGTTDLLDLAAQLTEHDIDIDLDANLVLQAYRAGEAGVDRHTTVRLLPGSNVTQAEGTKGSAKIRNRALVRHRVGWVEVFDSASQSTYGRRETGLNLGGTDSDTQATTTAQAAFVDTSVPEITLPVSITSENGPQPFVDFDIYDLITAPGITGTPGSHRVMTIAAAEDGDTGVITYTVELYPEV